MGRRAIAISGICLPGRGQGSARLSQRVQCPLPKESLLTGAGAWEAACFGRWDGPVWIGLLAFATFASLLIRANPAQRANCRRCLREQLPAAARPTVHKFRMRGSQALVINLKG